MMAINILFSNGMMLAGAWLILAVFGYLLFWRALGESPGLLRWSFFPLGGWAVLTVLGSYLRLIAAPFQVTAPIAVGIAVLLLLVRWWLRGGRTALGGWAQGLPMVAGIAAVGCLPLFYQMLVPNLRYPGNWGFDQRNYVFSGAGLLEYGPLLPIRTSTSPGGLLAPYWKYHEDCLRQLRTLPPAEMDTKCSDLFKSADQPSSMADGFAMIPRRGFACFDAVLASLLRLDAQQAYTLSTWLHHLLLIHAALFLSAAIGLSLSAAAAALFLAVFLPNSYLAVLADNRDQAFITVGGLTFVALTFLRGATPWMIIPLGAAMVVGYIEVAVPAIFAFLLSQFRMDRRWLESLRAVLIYGAGMFLLVLPFVVPLFMLLLRQTAKHGPQASMTFPQQYSQAIAPLDYAFGWNLLWPENPLLQVLVVAVDLILFALLVLGIIRLVRSGRWFSILGYGLVFLAGLWFLIRGKDYVAYKFMSVFWPLVVAALALGVESLRDLAQTKPSAAIRLLAVGAPVLLILLTLPGVLARGEFKVPGVFRLSGYNVHLEPKQSLWSALANGRRNDLTEIEQLSREWPRDEGILVLGNSFRRLPQDIGFIEFLLRRHTVYEAASKGEKNTRFTYRNIRPAGPDTPIRRVVFMNNTRTIKDPQHLPSRIGILGLRDPQFRIFNRFSVLDLPEKTPVLLVQSLTQPPLEFISAADNASLGLRSRSLETEFSVFLVNTPVVPKTVAGRFTLISPQAGPVKVTITGNRRKVFTGSAVAGQPIEWTAPLDPRWMETPIAIEILPAEGDPSPVDFSVDNLRVVQ